MIDDFNNNNNPSILSAKIRCKIRPARGGGEEACEEKEETPRWGVDGKTVRYCSSGSKLDSLFSFPKDGREGVGECFLCG